VKVFLAFSTLGLVLAGIISLLGRQSIESSQDGKNNRFLIQGRAAMEIKVIAGDKEVVFKLNDSQASKDLYGQLPLKIKVDNYGDNEKIFYPPKKLNTSSTPLANAKTGTLAYYAPWGNVVMFYKDFGSASGLYELGEAVSVIENINVLSGSISITPQ